VAGPTRTAGGPCDRFRFGDATNSDLTVNAYLSTGRENLMSACGKNTGGENVGDMAFMYTCHALANQVYCVRYSKGFSHA
jgi:hypothetical protein